MDMKINGVLIKTIESNKTDEKITEYYYFDDIEITFDSEKE